MVQFLEHELNTAPNGSRPLLESSIRRFGWIPNQSAVMAEAPALLEAYQWAHELFTKCSLTDEEKAVVWISTGLVHGCDYTVRAHEFIAKSNGVPAAYLQALKQGTLLPDRLEVLREFTRSVATCQGQVDEAQVDAFLAAGFSKAQVLEVVLGVAQKTMSNLVNSIARTVVDEAFAVEAG